MTLEAILDLVTMLLADCATGDRQPDEVVRHLQRAKEAAARELQQRAGDTCGEHCHGHPGAPAESL